MCAIALRRDLLPKACKGFPSLPVGLAAESAETLLADAVWRPRAFNYSLSRSIGWGGCSTIGGMLFSAFVGDSPSKAGACRMSASVTAFDAVPPLARKICLVSCGRGAATLRASATLLAAFSPAAAISLPHRCSPVARMMASVPCAPYPHAFSLPRIGQISPSPCPRAAANPFPRSKAGGCLCPGHRSLCPLHRLPPALLPRNPRKQPRAGMSCMIYALRASRTRLRCLLPATPSPVFAIPKVFRYLALRHLDFAANAALPGNVLREVVHVDAQTCIGA